MKEKRRGFISGVLTTVIALSLVGTAAATIGSRAITADYSDIKITLNGTQITPTDANGNVVEPFAVNGTTYLPVRAVANALGVDVEWDGKSGTVLLSNGSESKKSLEILKLLDLCVMAKGSISKQQNVNQSVSNYVSLSFAAYSQADMNALKDSVEDWETAMPSLLARIFLIQNQLPELKTALEGTPFYYYCDGLSTVAENMMEAYESQVEMIKNAASYCGSKGQVYYDNYFDLRSWSDVNLDSAEKTCQDIYDLIYSEAVREIG